VQTNEQGEARLSAPRRTEWVLRSPELGLLIAGREQPEPGQRSRTAAAGGVGKLNNKHARRGMVYW
jgi:hypothetical protein